MPENSLFNSNGSVNWDEFSSRYKAMKRAGGGPRDLNKKNLEYLESRLIDNGFTGDVLYVMLANAVEESGGNPRAKSKSGKYNGLYQIEDKHYNLKGKDKKSDFELIDEQVEYLSKNLKTVGDRGFLSGRRSKDGKKYRYGKNDHSKPRDEFWGEDTPLENRMYAFVNGFERPGDREGTYKNRLSVARIFSDSNDKEDMQKNTQKDISGDGLKDRGFWKSAARMMAPVPYTIIDEIYGRVKGTPTDLNKALYSSLDPTGGKPNDVFSALLMAGKVAGKYISGDFSDVEYKEDDDMSLPKKVAMAAWAKYNKLPYDESLIIDNNDGTFRLHKDIEKRIVTSRSHIKKSADINKKKLDELDEEFESKYTAAIDKMDLEGAARLRRDHKSDKNRVAHAIAYMADTDNLSAIDSVLSGKPGVFNEFNYKDRNLKKAVSEDKYESPLNVLGNYTMYKDDKGDMRYKDIWDLDVFGIPVDGILGGEPFKIQGIAGDSKKMEYGGTTRDEAEDYIFSYLTSNGFGDTQAVAIIANLIGESGLQANITRKGGSDFGLQQWIGPRKKALYEYAKGLGHEEPTFDDQLDFLIMEYNGEIPGSGWNFQTKGKNLHKGNPDKFGKEWDYYQYGKGEFENADSVANATIMYNQGFGRAYKQNLRNDFRIKQAERLAEKFGVDVGVSGMLSDNAGNQSEKQDQSDKAFEYPESYSFSEDRFEKWFEDYGKDLVLGLNYGKTKEDVSSGSQPVMSEMGSVANEENEKEYGIYPQNSNTILDRMVDDALMVLNYNVKGMSKEKTR